MKAISISLVLAVCLAVPVFAQVDVETQLRILVPFPEMKLQYPALTRNQYDCAVRMVAESWIQTPTKRRYLGTLSTNEYDSDSVSNPYGTYGSPYSSESINNPYGEYGSPYSPKSVRNPYTISAPKIVARDGTYLGRLSSNPYDPESVSNPYGRHGSPYSPNSINNPYGSYGSPVQSPESAESVLDSGATDH